MDLDAHLVETIPAPASSLCFDPTGKRLWMGGLGQELRTWDSADHRIETRGPAMEGPIAFRADGTALQLGITRDAKTGVSSLQLWDAGKQSAEIIDLPDRSRQLSWLVPSRPMEPHIGAVVEPAKGERTILVRETATGRFLPRIKFQAVGLAFSPDASLVAAWDEAGKIGLWSLPETAPLAILQSGDTPIRSIAFGLARGLAAPTTRQRALVAGRRRRRWHGDHLGSREAGPDECLPRLLYDIYALAFSPDGTTLASAGRFEPKLWDVATGRLLLDLRDRNTMTALAFSPDGTRLAVGSQTAFGYPGGVDVYQLENRTWHSDLPRACGVRSPRRSSLPMAG